ncbi:MAG: flagellar M-ring protein FliF [Hyphomicrobiaceae bacterium]|nr:flagellar M-ring protein FliF [Hyphomicrobiaceae bacterium]
MIGPEHLKRLQSNLLALGGRRLAALAIVGLTVAGAVGAGGYLLSRPELETVYGGLDARDVSRIGAALGEAGIPFDVNAEGSKVLVRRGQTARARMLLAEKGLPSSANAGYELFDRIGSIGLTSFMQEITRVRALEGEIARTIQGVKGVKAARVHIVLPDAGSFRRNRQAPSASVVIRTEAAGHFAPAQAIRHLVSAAVPELTVEQVTVLSTDGTILATAGDSESAAPARLVELEKAISKELQERARKTLSPYLGLDNFEISVAARLNTDKRQVNETAFDPDSRVERSVRIVKESGSSQNRDSRAPVGVEQNLPAEQPSGASGEVSARSNERREELTNFELSSKTTSTVSEGYRVEALTVAVLINRKRLQSALGEGADAGAVDASLKEIERLVGSAVGLVAERGDRITVAAVDFFADGEPMEPVAPSIGELLLSQSGSIVNALAVLAATVLLVWFGLRPALRAVLEPPGAAAGASGGALDAGSATLSGAVELQDEAEPNLIADVRSRLGRTPQKRLEQMVELDEEQASAILKQWMREARRA